MINLQGIHSDSNWNKTDLTLAMYRRAALFIRDEPEENLWGVNLSEMVHMANNSSEFRVANELKGDGWHLDIDCYVKSDSRMLPLYEAKMMHYFDHRFGSYDGQTEAQAAQGKLPELTQEKHFDPFSTAMPKYWIPEKWLSRLLTPKSSRKWLLGWRKITRSTDQRTFIASILPFAGFANSGITAFVESEPQPLLLANLSSFCFDYVVRQKLGGTNMAHFITKQLPVHSPLSYESSCSWSGGSGNLNNWILPRALELIYTAWNLETFAQDYNLVVPPFCWDEKRRFLLRCELDACYFHLYLTANCAGEWKPMVEEDESDIMRLQASFPKPRHAVTHIMDSFPIVKRRDEAAFGHYRTKDTILEIYDAMQHAMATGEAYVSPLDPPPGPPTDAEGRFLSMYELDWDNWPSHLHPPHPDWEESILSAWFGIRQKQWIHMEDEQIFPWDGRESFVYALMPYLAQERPGQTLEFLQQTALIAAYPEHCETLLHDEGLRKEYRESLAPHDWLQFSPSHTVRVRKVCERLQSAKILQTDPKSGATMCHDNVKLPPLPPELKPILTYVWTAADKLAGINERTADRANQTVRDVLGALRAG